MSCRACEEAASGHGGAVDRQPAPRRPAIEENGLIQRACAGGCGAGHAAAKGVPPSPGRPLSAAARGTFAARMGYDFGGVRIHDGPTADAAARANGARAFTVGRDIVFAAGEYRGDAPGDRLLAHELAHVVQQDGDTAGLQAQLTVGPAGDAYEREADRVADTVAAGGAATPTLRTGPRIQREPSLLGDMPRLHLDLPPPPLVRPGSIREAMVIPLPPAPAQLEPPSLGGPPRRPLSSGVPDLHLDMPRFTPVMIIPIPRCVPARPLTWTDFPGNSVPGGFGAVTRVVTPQITVDGNPMFQARLRDQPASAVMPRYRNPGNRPTNGCAPVVARCRQYLRAHPGNTWGTNRPTPDTCPASIISIDTATTEDECETVVGAGCDTAAQAESDRLLAHEQLHFDIACTLVGRANDALAAGTHTPAQLAAWLHANLQPQEDAYDHDAVHGCDPGGQAAWVANVAGGLSAVPLPAVAP